MKKNRRKSTISNRECQRRLLLSWVMELTAHLQDEHGFSRKQAIERAYMVRNLLDGLGRGEAVFTYKKRNGEERFARGTLCRGVSKELDEYVYKTDAPADSPRLGVYIYWDLDEQGFRAFTAHGLMQIIDLRYIKW